MKFYLSGPEAIRGLHELGYTNDFQLRGNDLLWVQEKVFIRAGDFSILECHRFCNYQRKGTDLVIYGVIALCQNVKGILTSHSPANQRSYAPVLLKKLKEMCSYSKGQ